MGDFAPKDILWYTRPAQQWIEALPIGNGRLAGMVCGRVSTERIHLNEDSVWSGGAQTRDNPDALSHLAEIRRLLFEGKINEAERLACLTLTGTPDGQRHYQPLGDLFLYFLGIKSEAADYRRELDLEDGVVRVRFKLGGYRYKREVFCSYPDQVMVIRLTTENPEGLRFLAQMGRGAMHMPEIGRGAAPNRDVPLENERMWHPVSYQAFCDGLEILAPDTLMLKGSTASENGIRFRAALRAVAEGGTVGTIGDHLIVEKAKAVTLILAASTSFRSDNPQQDCLERIEKAAEKTYAELLETHLEDHRGLFGRVRLELDAPGEEGLWELPTDERVARVQKGGRDTGLIRLCFQYGRYLLMASSRPGSLPANLQGKWTDELLPSWDSKYTININIQMNYWPAENCNLSECHQPLFDMLERMRVPGRRTAKTMYGCRGFVAHHNTDLWGDTAPCDIYVPATFWPMGALWFCLHLWDHYEFTGDRAFLRRAYETMKESAEFYLDFLVEDGKGRLVTCPSLSPENSYRLPDGGAASLTIGSAMDMEMIHELFDRLIKASEILDIDAGFRQTLKETDKRLLKPAANSFGGIQEWYEDYPETFAGHHHFSPVFSLYPGEWFTPRVNPKYAAAAEATVERRMANRRGYHGFPCVWATCLYARLFKGDKAAQTLYGYLRDSLAPNLFNRFSDRDYTFQIDGNFGFTAGLAEMLLQSHAGEVSLLPALSKDWPSGRVRGLRARGGFEVDIEWEQGRIARAFITSLAGNTCRLKAPQKPKAIRCGGVISAQEEADGAAVFATQAGCRYELVF